MDVYKIKAEIYENFMDDYNRETKNILDENRADIFETIDELKYWMGENGLHENIEEVRDNLITLNNLVSNYFVMDELVSRNKRIENRIKEEIRGELC